MMKKNNASANQMGMGMSAMLYVMPVVSAVFTFSFPAGVGIYWIISTVFSFFQTMLEIGGVETPYRNDSLSVTSALFIERPRVYLNDHNEARTLDDVGMLKEDFKMLEEKGIR